MSGSQFPSLSKWVANDKNKSINKSVEFVILKDRNVREGRLIFTASVKYDRSVVCIETCEQKSTHSGAKTLVCNV